MKAAILYEPHTPIKVEDIDLDEPELGEVRVKLVAAGACHSDYHRVDGHTSIDTLPYVLGHEGAGIIQEVGADVRNVSPGDHVIFSLTAQCGRCRNCTAGRSNLCEWHLIGTATMPDGSRRFSKNGVRYYADLATFSEETVVPESYVVKIRDDMPLEKACLLGCGVMTGIGAVVNRAKVEAGSTVVVFGCGGVGLNVIQGAYLASASKIIAVDKIPFKLEKAKEFGATHLIKATTENPVSRVMEITNGGADYAFEVIGFPETTRQAFDCIRTGGTAVMLGVQAKSSEIAIPAMKLFYDRTVMGAFYGGANPRVDFAWLIDLYMDNRLKLDELITKYRPMNEVNEAFHDMKAGKTARTVFKFN